MIPILTIIVSFLLCLLSFLAGAMVTHRLMRGQPPVRMPAGRVRVDAPAPPEKPRATPPVVV